MRWEDERYVRLYTRDTADWLSLSFEAQGLMGLVMRKVDRAGILPLGRHGKRAVAIALGHAGRWEAISPALDELLADGCVRVEGDKLFIPNFIEAQEAAQSDAQRQRESRAKARTLAAMAVTNRDEMSQPVTGGHVVSQPVTPSRAVPSLPSRAEILADDASAPPPMDGVRAAGALDLPELAKAAKPDRRKPGGPLREKPPPNPRHAPTVARLSEIFARVRGHAYGWHKRDAKGIQALLGMCDDDAEIDRRFERGLNTQFKGKVDNFYELPGNWNALGGATAPARVTNFRRASVPAEDIDQKQFAVVGREHGF